MRSRCCPCVRVYVCVSVSGCTIIVARQRLCKGPLIVLKQWLCFLCGPYRVKRKEAISSSQNFLFVVYLMILI
jgi:hypothetical protein